ncbi:MAG: hypothetical protein ACR2PS_09385 [Pseudomonadales bacterium]
MAISETSTPQEIFNMPAVEKGEAGAIHSPVNQLSILLTVWLAGSVWSIFYAAEQFGNSPNALYIALMVFLWFNAVFCVLEFACLWFNRRYLREQWDRIDGGLHGRGLELFIAALKSPVNHRNLFTRKEWSKGFIAWGVLDRDYGTQNGFGYISELGNGVLSIIPTHLLLVFLFSPVVSPQITGMIGIAFFYQTIWGTSLYMMGLLTFGDNKENGFKGKLLLIWGNLPWLIMSVIGLYASARLVLDNSYQILFS